MLDAAGFRQPYAADDSTIIRSPVALPPLDLPKWQSSLRAFAWGMRCTGSTVLSLVLFAPISASARWPMTRHFSLAWALDATLLVWAGPAQIILISTLGSGATIVQAAIAVTVSAIRLFPMVVSVLPMMRTPRHQAASSHAGRAFHRGHAVGRMLSLPAAGAARAAHRLRPRARLRPAFRRPDRDHDRLSALRPTCRSCLPPRSCC